MNYISQPIKHCEKLLLIFAEKIKNNQFQKTGVVEDRVSKHSKMITFYEILPERRSARSIKFVLLGCRPIPLHLKNYERKIEYEYTKFITTATTYRQGYAGGKEIYIWKENAADENKKF